MIQRLNEFIWAAFCCYCKNSEPGSLASVAWEDIRHCCIVPSTRGAKPVPLHITLRVVLSLPVVISKVLVVFNKKEQGETSLLLFDYTRSPNMCLFFSKPQI